MSLFEAPFATSALSDHENNALWASSLMAMPPPPPEVHPLAGLPIVNLSEVNLTQWHLIRPRCCLWHENATPGSSRLSSGGHHRGFTQVGDVNPCEILSPLFWARQHVQVLKSTLSGP